MDVEKPASKGHGFFALFDWGKKSKKRLFVGSTSSSPNLSKKFCNWSPGIAVHKVQFLQGVWLNLYPEFSLQRILEM